MSKKVGKLLLGILSIWLFIVVIVPFCTQGKNAQQILKHIEANDIDTRALFYTESEAAVKAEFLMRRTKK